MFLLDGNLNPTVVAGVPPDYFSATGQLWGNPLYDWEAMRKTGFKWWIDRIKATIEMVDLIRLDHFRGFEAYWAVPAGMATAEKGEWVKAPGQELLTVLQKTLGGLPLIAEDLGVITPEVNQLRRQFNLPGMRILQFAFDGKSDNPYLPHNFDFNTVVYTGTHDNDTTRGWYNNAPDHEKDHVRRYLARDGSDIAWDLIRTAWASVADYAIAPLQDVLDLGTEARMNYPGRSEGNWGWRYRKEMLREHHLDRLAELTELYGR
jgi:4-alpha-glucanotransferase